MVGNTYRIGRAAGADIQLDDPSVSGLHAEVTVAGDGTALLVDRCSRNGTYVYDAAGWVPVQQRIVTEGDRLRLGGCETSLPTLLSLCSGRTRVVPAGRPQAGPPAGPVRRNPETGDIVGIGGMR